MYLKSYKFIKYIVYFVGAFVGLQVNYWKATAIANNVYKNIRHYYFKVLLILSISLYLWLLIRKIEDLVKIVNTNENNLNQKTKRQKNNEKIQSILIRDFELIKNT